MLKKISLLVLIPLLFAGCATTFTNLTPLQQPRNPNNLYPVEVAFTSRQESLRWDTIKPQIVVGTESFPMRPTQLMTNRWEGLLPISTNASVVHYRYKFDFNYNTLGTPKPDSALSPDYTLQIIESK